MAIAVTCAITFAHRLWISNLLTLPTDMFRASRVGTASGLSGMGDAVGGMIANLGTGYLVQNYSCQLVFLMAGRMHPWRLWWCLRCCCGRGRGRRICGSPDQFLSSADNFRISGRSSSLEIMASILSRSRTNSIPFTVRYRQAEKCSPDPSTSERH